MCFFFNCRHVPAGGNTRPVFVHFISVLAAPNHCFYNGHGVPSSPCCLYCHVGCLLQSFQSTPHCISEANHT